MRCDRVIFLITMLLIGGCVQDEDNRSAVGTLEWDRIEIAAQVAEPIQSWDAQEGSQVSSGQRLLKLDSARAQAHFAAAEAAQAQAAARLAELERGTRPERIAQAKATLNGHEQELQYLQREVTRLEALLARKLAAPGDVDQAHTAVSSALALRNAARASLDELERGAMPEEREQARQAVAVAEAELQTARIELTHTEITAPVAGRLDELPFKVGERPPVGSVVAVILAGERPYARVYAPEGIRAQLHPGSAATISVDGIEGTFSGALRKIAADPSFTPYYALTEHDRGRLSFVAEVDVDTNGRTLPAGVPVQVHFDLDNTQD